MTAKTFLSVVLLHTENATKCLKKRPRTSCIARKVCEYQYSSINTRGESCVSWKVRCCERRSEPGLIKRWLGLRTKRKKRRSKLRSACGDIVSELSPLLPFLLCCGTPSSFSTKVSENREEVFVFSFSYYTARYDRPVVESFSR